MCMPYLSHLHGPQSLGDRLELPLPLVTVTAAYNVLAPPAFEEIYTGHLCLEHAINAEQAETRRMRPKSILQADSISSYTIDLVQKKKLTWPPTIYSPSRQ